jgi:hypothetical protein
MNNTRNVIHLSWRHENPMPSREPILRRGSPQIRSCCFAASGFLLPPPSHKRTRISALREPVIKLGWSCCCHNLYQIRFQPSTFCFQSPPFQRSGSLSSLGIRKLWCVCESCGSRCRDLSDHIVIQSFCQCCPSDLLLNLLHPALQLCPAFSCL